MSKCPWPPRLKAITFFSPVSLHFSASSMATRMACALSGAGMTLAPQRTQPRSTLGGECRCALGLGELHRRREGIQLLDGTRFDVAVVDQSRYAEDLAVNRSLVEAGKLLD